MSYSFLLLFLLYRCRFRCNVLGVTPRTDFFKIKFIQV